VPCLWVIWAAEALHLTKLCCVKVEVTRLETRVLPFSKLAIVQSDFEIADWSTQNNQFISEATLSSMVVARLSDDPRVGAPR
jgi:hypothetical protein